MTGMLFRSTGDVLGRLRRDQGLSESELANRSGINVEEIRTIESGTPPSEEQLETLSQSLNTSPEAVRFLSGEVPEELRSKLIQNPERALEALQEAFPLSEPVGKPSKDEIEPIYGVETGTLYHGDCLKVLPRLEPETFDLIFADPPFNLNKDYGKDSADDMAEDEYLQWCTKWVDQAIDLLKPGGSFFVYNLPKWNIHLASYISKRLSFRHWIVVDVKLGLPIPKRLYPSHYSLLYFVKGKTANIFDPPRLPIETCRHCGGEQSDYGGYKNKLNPKGMNLTDVWDDVSPVRHSKYMDRQANQLSLKLLHRVLRMSTEEGDRVLDPFGGAGTTYAACEVMGREWTGIEINDCTPIIERLSNLETEREQIGKYEAEQNVLFTEDAIDLRTEYQDEFGFNMTDYDLSEIETNFTGE